MQTNQRIIFAGLYSIGAIALLVSGLKLPKVSSPLSIGMTIVGFCYFLMAAFTMWYYTPENMFENTQFFLNELRFDSVFAYVCPPLMWWLICYLFFSLGQPVHHH